MPSKNTTKSLRECINIECKKTTYNECCEGCGCHTRKIKEDTGCPICYGGNGTVCGSHFL